MDDLLLRLKLTDYKSNRLTHQKVLCIGEENVKGPFLLDRSSQACCFLRKLLALDETARSPENTNSLGGLSDIFQEDDLFDVFKFDFINRHSDSVHPLDVLCAVLHCSDHFLQQEIMSKMSMCQFALPLLLPCGEGKNYTFMLWAMRDIVKRWRPQSLAGSKGFKEDILVHISMPLFSFTRLGKCSMSKSRILNKVLTPAYIHHDFFLHRDLGYDCHQREISEGLVEISWYFPGGRKNSDVFPDPIAVTNLRGDLKFHSKQLDLLTQVSSAVFVFVERIQEEDYTFLLNFQKLVPNYYLIYCPPDDKNENAKSYLQKLCSELILNKNNILVKDRKSNEAILVKQLQIKIQTIMRSSPNNISLEKMAETSNELGIQLDESAKQCKKARQRAKEITSEIHDIAQYKKDNMKLQGEIWKQLTTNEKEICRMKNQGDEDCEQYRSRLISENLQLRKKQNQHNLPDGVQKFLEAITDLTQIEKQYFLKWMKFDLESISRDNLSELQNEYKIKFNKTDSAEELQSLDKRMFASSLGVEHFLRELGQFYETECFMVKDVKLKRFANLPELVAGLLLDGFPLELIDGDVSNIPMQWVRDVLIELDKKIRGKCRMRVITVLGVQSTGKSTLLNTMFGLQFPVASGRCTRGAFITLIKVQENFQEELECEFILVIDTEGLKAPELVSLDGSYEHDNEMATLLIGLSDVAIINMSMENAADMKDILQIVVHAFLRMKEIGKKPNCQFVHQNVNDVSASTMNMRDRKKLLEHLDEMTRVAAKMEKRSGITSFSDIMTYDLEENNWYIPSLWQGVPPMAPVNSGYSEGISTFKKNVLETIKNKLKSQKPQDIYTFLDWLKSLWNAVKHESFLFSFRNSLVAEAYDHLSRKYSELEWNFRKEMYNWMVEMENSIKNQDSKDLSTSESNYKDSMKHILQKEEKRMSQMLETYFQSESENKRFIEKYREDFFNSIKCLGKEMNGDLSTKLSQTLQIQIKKHEIEVMNDGYIKKIEDEVDSLLNKCKRSQMKFNDMDLKSEFDTMWQSTLEGLQFKPLPKHNVDQSMLQQLRRDMSQKGGRINEKLLGVKELSEFSQKNCTMDNKYIDLKWYQNCVGNVWYQAAGVKDFYEQEYCYKTNKLVKNVIALCTSYVEGKVNSKEDYHETFSWELLNMVNKRLQEKDVSQIHTTDYFELDLKLLILGKAVSSFQGMHDAFVQNNNPKLCLESQKSKYFLTFKNIFLEKDLCQNRAKLFCDSCLKPALVLYINSHLGKEIVNDILRSVDCKKYSSRTFFQYTVLNELLEKMRFDQYIKYITDYEAFVKNWIISYIEEKYRSSDSIGVLKTSILTGIMKEIRHVLQDPEILESSSISHFLAIFCKKLRNSLVISQNDMKLVIFRNSAPASQFSAAIKSLLKDIESGIVSEMKCLSVETVLAEVSVKPVDELFKKVFGCGKQCPFCKVPCEAGGADHKEHFSSVHRPQGLGGYRIVTTNILHCVLCSTDVVSSRSFQNSYTDWKFHPYKDYRQYFPDWAIQPDASISASDYWKFIFKEFNQQFAEEFKAKPAELPGDWYKLNQEQAVQSLKETFLMK